MAIEKLRGKELLKMGFPEGKAAGIAINAMIKYFKRTPILEQKEILRAVLNSPQDFLEDEALANLAHELLPDEDEQEEIALLPKSGEYRTYGSEHIEAGAKNQMDVAMRLPVTVGGALMPDAHHGYGLPIGGVLATRNAVIPYGVGVDIGCRMCLSFYDLPESFVEHNRFKLKTWLGDHTRFGMNGMFDDPMDDPIFERTEFREVRTVRNLKDRAYRQIGSSGSGNHFVEFGVVEILAGQNEWNVPAGRYVAVLSHSGSRGLGANIANHYTKVAMNTTLLPKEAKHLAWLGLDTEAGQEYWLAMNLAGDYASACHHHIHRRLGKALGLEPLAMVENHHNFAWKEHLADGSEAIVHRKGATPAGKGMLGIIPGSMAAPGYIVRGLGSADSLNSASHGAGRQMSRTQARNNVTMKSLKQLLESHNVELIGGGPDEAPQAYKDIEKVMAHQTSLVEVLGTFMPKVVRMDRA